jgi:hypothetical protein
VVSFARRETRIPSTSGLCITFKQNLM